MYWYSYWLKSLESSTDLSDAIKELKSKIILLQEKHKYRQNNADTFSFGSEYFARQEKICTKLIRILEEEDTPIIQTALMSLDFMSRHKSLRCFLTEILLRLSSHLFVKYGKYVSLSNKYLFLYYKLFFHRYITMMNRNRIYLTMNYLSRVNRKRIHRKMIQVPTNRLAKKLLTANVV